MAEPVNIVDKKKMERDAANHDMILRDIYVPKGMGLQLSERYKMPSVLKMGELQNAVNSGYYNITPSQANDIVFIVMSQILYGVYEFICDNDINNPDISNLITIVDKVEDVSDSILNGSKHKSDDLYVLLEGPVKGYRWFVYSNNSLAEFYPRKTQYIESGFFKDFLYMFWKNLGHYCSTKNVECRETLLWHSNERYSVKCIYDINRNGYGDKVNQILDFIRTVKNMGDKYVSGSAINLYADAVLSGVYESYKAHQGRVVYPHHAKTK